MYRQLLENSFVEIMASEDKEFVKVNGKADFGVDEETQKWIYEHNPVLPRLYNTQSMLDNSLTIAIRKDISEVLLHFINVKSN